MTTAGDDGRLDSRAASAEHQRARFDPSYGMSPTAPPRAEDVEGHVTRVQAGDRLILQLPPGYPMEHMVEQAARARRLTVTGGVLVTAPDVRVWLVPAGVDPLDIELRADDDHG